MKKLVKKFCALTLSLTLLISMTTTAFASSPETNSIQNEIADTLSESDVTRSAGLAWGPVTVGNVKLYMTNPHVGIVPGIGNVSHVNFHADNAKTGKAIVNYHIVKYTSGNSNCLYVYDSVSKKVIINQCFGNWTDAAAAVVEAVKSAVQAVLSEADWLATLAIWAVVIVVVADLIIPMDPVPIIPFSLDLDEGSIEDNVIILPSAA